MRAALVAVGVAALAAALAFLVVSRRVPEIDVRTSVLRTSVGSTPASSPPGELFRCTRDGLHRIDVAVTPLGENPWADLELVLRDGGPDGPILRRAHASERLPAPQGNWLEWVAFDFEPVADSGGRLIHFTFVPPTWFVSTWARVRGIASPDGSWGNGSIDGGVLEGELLSEHADLRGLAFAVERLSGPATLTLIDPESGAVVRHVERRFSAPVLSGWAVFGFEPIEAAPGERTSAGSRWRTYRYRLEVKPWSVLRTRAGKLDPTTFHGSGRVDERLAGMTRGSERFDDRDLVFRAWSTSGPAVALGLLSERMGWRLPVAVALFLAACGALALALSRAAAR